LGAAGGCAFGGAELPFRCVCATFVPAAADGACAMLVPPVEGRDAPAPEPPVAEVCPECVGVAARR
jgi:hypothetical protein